jgi:hypothetical protein
MPVEPQRQDEPVAAALEVYQAPLAKSAAPVALQQSHILRMTSQDQQVGRDKQAPLNLTTKTTLAVYPSSLQKLSVV